MPPSWNTILAVAVVPSLFMAGCGSEKTEAPAALPARLSVPSELTVKQRTTTAVPGSDGMLLLTIGDITRSQVMASLALDDGELVLPARSISPKNTATFKFGDSEYVLMLKELDNELVGDDNATFVISSPSASGLTEEGKIEKLIAAIAALPDAIFIRNGAEHSAAEAADHLRTKWDAAGAHITTAQAFIENVASKSSVSGKPYQIKMADGPTVNAGEYLREKLAEIESGPPEK